MWPGQSFHPIHRYCVPLEDWSVGAKSEHACGTAKLSTTDLACQVPHFHEVTINESERKI